MLQCIYILLVGRRSIRVINGQKYDHLAWTAGNSRTEARRRSRHKNNSERRGHGREKS